MKISPINPGLIDLVMRERDFTLYYQNKPLLSTGGREICSANQRVLKQLIMEVSFRNCLSDEEMSVYSLLSVIADFLDQGKDPFLDYFELLSNQDPFLKLRQGKTTTGEMSGGSEFRDLLETEPVLFNMMFFGTNSLLEAFARFTLEKREMLLPGIKTLEWKDFLRQAYLALPLYGKAVVNLLSFTHHSAIVLPLMLAGGYITGIEYVNGLPAIHLRDNGNMPASPFSMPVAHIGREDFRASVSSILNDVRDAVGFLSCFGNIAEDGLNFLIGKGEGHDLEFKSTLRWDLRAGKTSQQIERACLKTISAFLNSNGGILLIGVRDDGSIEGVESDKFANMDKFLLHLWTLVRSCFGTDVSPNIQANLEETAGKTVCVVKCSRSSRPVFLKQPGFEEEFYVRVGPGTVALAVSEALKYIGDHFEK